MVLAIGSPFGFDYLRLQAGIISGGRSWPNESYVPLSRPMWLSNPG